MSGYNCQPFFFFFLISKGLNGPDVEYERTVLTQIATPRKKSQPNHELCLSLIMTTLPGKWLHISSVGFGFHLVQKISKISYNELSAVIHKGTITEVKQNILHLTFQLH